MSGKKVDPSKVGQMFVKDYYQKISKQPEHMHFYYLSEGPANSSVSHFHEDQPTAPGITSHEKIQAQVAKIKVDPKTDIMIKTIDSQSCGPDGGVLVVVTGFMVCSGRKRFFTQTFVLNKVTDTAGGTRYYVFNDVLRYHPSPSAGGAKQGGPKAAVGGRAAPPSAEEKAARAQAQAQQAAQAKAAQAKAAFDAAAAKAAAVAAAEEAEASKGPQSWASMAKKKASAPVKPVPRKAAPAREPKEGGSAGSPGGKSGGGAPNSGDGGEIDKQSVYVSNINWDTTEEKLKAFFTKFGKIKSVNLKENKMKRAPGYAFIEFVDASSVIAAIAEGKEKKIEVDKRQLNVEERKAPTFGPKSGDRRVGGDRRSGGRGRGDGEGRGGARGGGRGGSRGGRGRGEGRGRGRGRGGKSESKPKVDSDGFQAA